MKYKFYDVKEKKSLMAEVVEKKCYGEEGRKRYSLKAKTEDGRTLNTFVNKDTYDKF